MSLRPDDRLMRGCPFCGAGGHVFVTQRKAHEFVGSVVCVSNECETRGPAVVGTTGEETEAMALKAWDQREPPGEQNKESDPSRLPGKP